MRGTPCFFSALILGLALARCAPDEAEPSDRRPHVFVVVVDTLREDEVAVAGEGPGMPHLSTFGRDAVVFEQAISAAPWTLPSVASILTGAWPSVHRAEGRLPRLRPVSPDVPLAAELFSAAGYRTAGFTNAAFLGSLLGFDRGFERFDHVPAFNVEARRADATVDAALRDLETSSTDARPAFVLLHLFDPHLNYDPPAGYGPAREGAEPVSWATLRPWLDRRETPPDAVRADVRDAYRGELAFVDAQLGRFLDGLEQRGLLEDSVVVVVADHGEEFWDHGGFEHGHGLHRELVHVPLLIRPPRSAGLEARRVAATVRTVDLLPTLLELAGLEGHSRMAGRSLLGLMRGELEEPRPAYSEACLYGPERSALRHEGVVWISEGLGRPGALYDLESDPGEQEDRARLDPARARWAQRWMMDHLARVRRQSEGVRAADLEDVSPQRIMEFEDSLRALGYVERDR